MPTDWPISCCCMDIWHEKLILEDNYFYSIYTPVMCEESHS